MIKKLRGGVITCYANNNVITHLDVKKAKTLCARDWKGFGTGWDTMNAVLELEYDEEDSAL